MVIMHVRERPGGQTVKDFKKGILGRRSKAKIPKHIMKQSVFKSIKISNKLCNSEF